MSSSTLSNTNNTLAPLGAYLNAQPADGNQTAFERQYTDFAALMGTRPQFYNAYTDSSQGIDGMPSSAGYGARSFAGTGASYVGPTSGTIPLVGVPMFLNSSTGTYTVTAADYTGIVDAWANAGYKTVEFRIGYEFNGSMSWSPQNATERANFVTAWQQIANLVHTEGQKDGITADTVWNPQTTNGSSYDVQTLYPGNSYADIISVDLYGGGTPNNYYDVTTGQDDSNYQTWAANPLNVEHYYQYENFTNGDLTPALGSSNSNIGYGWSVQDTIDFAQKNGKPFAFDETDAPAGQNDTVFPNWLASTIAGVKAEGVPVDHVDIWSNGNWNFVDNGSQSSEAAAWATDFGANSEDNACFLAGTGIQTPGGEILVERLAVGDLVVTATGAHKRLVWIGTGRSLVTRGRRSAATPVIVRKGALADNVPYRDLRITKGHSLYLDDVMIPVEFLVNHRSILWDDAAQEVTVYHLELEAHNVLLANGAPAESYRDDGNRWLFHNANTGWSLPPKPPCAPVLTGGPVVDTVWHRLLQRSGPRPKLPLTDDPDVHLVVNGRRLNAASRRGEEYLFRLPECSASAHIVSREGVPAELGSARDPRSLGVALKRIQIRRGSRLVLVQADDDRLVDGFHGFEPYDRIRWTNGDAALPASLFSGFSGEIELVLHLTGAMSYPLYAEPKQQRAA